MDAKGPEEGRGERVLTLALALWARFSYHGCQAPLDKREMIDGGGWGGLEKAPSAPTQWGRFRQSRWCEL
jgi:hypothetical protein